MAAKAATTTIPIVFATSADPVQFGLVASLSRPGGNLTGVASLSGEVGPKLLELVHEAVPAATLIGLHQGSHAPGRDRDTARATLSQGLAVSAFPRYVPV